jgi:hypothetical protein
MENFEIRIFCGSCKTEKIINLRELLEDFCYAAMIEKRYFLDVLCPDCGMYLCSIDKRA